MDQEEKSQNAELILEEVSGKIPLASNQRRERRAHLAERVNKQRNEHLREKIIESLRLSLTLIEDYAKKNGIPEHVPLPASMPITLTEQSLDSIPYRNYMVRRHILNAQDTLMEASTLAREQFTSFYRHKLMQQNRAVHRILSFLKALDG